MKPGNSKKRLLISVSFLVFSLAPVVIKAQNFNIRSFTSREGLAHNDVTAITADSSGFMWFGTWDGLSRYDGYSFKNYYHRPDDSLSLPYFSVRDLAVDGADNLWLLTDIFTLAKYDRTRDIFLPAVSIWKDLPSTIRYLNVDENGYPWMFTADSAFRFDFLNNRFHRYSTTDNKYNSDITSQSITGFHVTPDESKLWLITKDTVFEMNKNNENNLKVTKRYPVVKKVPIKWHDYNFRYWAKLYISNSGAKWIFSNYGLFLFEENQGIFREFRGTIPKNEFTGEGFLFWASRNDGIYFFDRKSSGISHIDSDNTLLVKSIYCWNNEMFWFSNTSESGASMGLKSVIFTPDYFKHYPVLSNKDDIAQIYAIAKDPEGRLWAGGRGKNPVILINKDSSTEKLIIPEYETRSNRSTVRSLTPSDDGMWIGFFMDLLLFYNYNTGKFERHVAPTGGLRAIVNDTRGRFYLHGNMNDILYYDPEIRDVRKRIPYKPASPIYKLIIDRNGTLWAGLNKSAIFSYGPATERSETVYLLQNEYNIEDICLGDNGDIWLAMLGGGVCNYNPSTGKKTFYTTANGLANNVTYSILKDNSGNVWVATNTGISRINGETGFIRSFGPNDGLKIIEFNSGASFKDKNGEFFMGGMGGIVSFFPDSINIREFKSRKQRIIINEISTSGRPIPFRRNLNLPDTIMLGAGENNFQVFFSSSDFINSDKTIYRYWLSDIDEEWKETDSWNRSISYGNLDPGWYTLRLQATDMNGNWCPLKEIVITIEPFYYQTTLFRIAVPLTILLIISGMILLYIRQLKQREAQKQNSLRLQSLRGQMNPHFIFNSLNSINYFISNNDKLSANRYIADFSKLIRSILHNMNYDYITLEKEIESVEEYLKIEHLRFGDKFDYQVYVSGEIDTGGIKVSPGLVQPFVENAIWHGIRGLENRKGNISILFELTGDRLTCTVEDDGIGRKRSNAMKSGNDHKKSRGISIVMERLKILGSLQNREYKVIIEDLNPGFSDTGTKVTIHVPVAGRGNQEKNNMEKIT